MDNCGRENKNRFLFSYLEALVRKGVFKEVFVGFLPLGHTHKDIDQVFSRTAERLRSNDAITLHDMHVHLSNVYGNIVVVSEMQTMINWSVLCNNTKCLTNVSGFSSHRHSMFSRTGTSKEVQNEAGKHISNVCCTIKANADDDWKPLHSKVEKASFLCFVPDLSLTSPLTTNPTPDIDDVTDRINSEEGRINSTRKVQELKKLRDTVYMEQIDPFSWNLYTVIEACSKQWTENVASINGLHPSDEAPALGVNDYTYEIDTFVIARENEQSDDHFIFWIGRMNNVKLDTDGIVSSLEVHWYESTDKKDVLNAKYKPAFIQGRKHLRGVAWLYIISSDSVVVLFDALTCSNCLPTMAKKMIQQERSNYK